MPITDKKFGKKIEYYRSLIDSTGFHAPIGETINLKFTSISKGSAQFDLDVDMRHLNSLGTVQGGVLTIMADAAMGISYASLLDYAQHFATIELKINFLKSVTSGHLCAIGNITHFGKRTGLTECKIYLTDLNKQTNPNLVAVASSTLLLI